MAQTDSHNITVAPIAPTRRRFLSQAAGVAAGGTVFALATIPPASAMVAPSGLLDPANASPALRAAAIALDEAHERLKAAKARFTADDLKAFEWRELNPKPTNWRAQKKWGRKWQDMQDATVGESWAAKGFSFPSNGSRESHATG
jgi:hypothetical protein